MIFSQVACTFAAALQNGRLLALEPHRRRQQLSAAGISLPTPRPIHVPRSSREADHSAQDNSESAKRQLREAAPTSSTPPLATDDPVAELIDEPDPGITAANITVTADPTATPRPFKVGFFDEPNRWSSPKIREYVMGKLAPAAAAVLARSIRVRDPTGPLPLLGYPDERGNPIPDIFGTGNMTDGIDADIVFKVTTEGEDTLSLQGPLCFTAAAFAYTWFSEARTGRPIYGIITLCRFGPDRFHSDLETMIHEMIHPLAFSQTLYGEFPGYKEPYFDVVLQTENVSYIQSPQVRAAARRHFDCPTLRGAALEDDLGRSSAGSHWESRLFRGEVMDPQAFTRPEGSGQRSVLTDLTLAIFQDSNWYDVKYGSGGFNTFGYHTGCEFADGTFEQALAVPAAQPFLCNASQVRQDTCLWDASASAMCIDDAVWDGFVSREFVNGIDFECHIAGKAPGLRCLQSGSDLDCASMACSPGGTLLVNGAPCDPDVSDCPDEELMCGDPGLLTCLGALNDCSGRGDCFKGACFCHMGWGGDDCSVPICLSQCDDGSPCPPSGFCGVPECGEWSEGSESRGVPCNAPANFSEPPLATYEAIGDAAGPVEQIAPAPAPAPAPLDGPSIDDPFYSDDYADRAGSDDESSGSPVFGPPVIGTPGVTYPAPPSAAPSVPSASPADLSSSTFSDLEAGDGARVEGSGALRAAAGTLRALTVAMVAAGAVAAW